jgi:hypothetical protein
MWVQVRVQMWVVLVTLLVLVWELLLVSVLVPVSYTGLLGRDAFFLCGPYGAWYK